MNLLTLYYFVELARELHVTNTAQKLYISQQNLSQHIQRLEQYYGVSLFHRKPKLALTYEGEQLYAVAVKILAGTRIRKPPGRYIGQQHRQPEVRDPHLPGRDLPSQHPPTVL